MNHENLWHVQSFPLGIKTEKTKDWLHCLSSYFSRKQKDSQKKTAHYKEELQIIKNKYCRKTINQDLNEKQKQILRVDGVKYTDVVYLTERYPLTSSHHD
ncbi:CLUMA_CG007710, isoform A [Clunio marinus]|uniref:CLUMA_CG007710, isoform A n=1 Tax=Clunio marinus TaxID=568069 RepID=A0A1J1I342_9DIPT|nr:CLUMA_CG007710, isoform A [Clunio marinus]